MMRLNIGPNQSNSQVQGQSIRTILKVDQIILKDNDLVDMLNTRLDKVEELEAKVLSLEKKVDEMLEMMKGIWYAPGMPGYQQAEADFNTLTGESTES